MHLLYELAVNLCTMGYKSSKEFREAYQEWRTKEIKRIGAAHGTRVMNYYKTDDFQKKYTSWKREIIDEAFKIIGTLGIEDDIDEQNYQILLKMKKECEN